jgi:hypothetical protein
MTETHIPRWLNDRLISTMRKVITVRDQLRCATSFREQRRLEWVLKQAQIDHAWLEHWVAKT